MFPTVRNEQPVCTSMSPLLKRQNEKERLERYRKFSFKTNSKLSRLSHEELMIPLIYWNCPPRHKITAMYVQKSMRSGDIIITGSENGEFIIWKPYNTLHHPPDTNPTATAIPTSPSPSPSPLQSQQAPPQLDETWIPIAMTFSTNTTPVVSILASFQHKEQAAFMASHADGETVIFSIYGAGALKIGCGERAILNQGVYKIYGYSLLNESYQYCVCSNFFNHNLHIVDLHKGKEINYNANENLLPMQIVDITFFHLQLSSHCAIIDSRGKIATFKIGDKSGVEPLLNFESRLKYEALNIGITFDNQYLCAISKSEFVLFANDPLRFISYYSLDEEDERFDDSDTQYTPHSYWDGMIVLDKYFYGIITDKNAVKTNQLLFERSNSNIFKENPSLSQLVENDYIASNGKTKSSVNVGIGSTPSAPDPTIDSYSSLPSVSTAAANDSDRNLAFIRPFLVLLWQNDAKYLTLYLVAKDAPNVLTPIVHLLIPQNVKCEWKVVTTDNHHIYVGTEHCQLISYSMDKLQNIAVQTVTIMRSKKYLNYEQCIGEMQGELIGSLQDAFITNKDNKTCASIQESKEEEKKSEFDEPTQHNADEEEMNGYYKEIGIEDTSDITASCMNLTCLGVLLCIGYVNGEIYIYNVSEGEAIMEIHTRLSRVTSLLLLCSDSSANDSVVGDGVLFVGYNDGFIEAFNCKTGQQMISKQCHFGGVSKIVTFEQDYYVFSIGSDNSLCSFLVYSQLVTMKSVQDLLFESNMQNDDGNIDGDADMNRLNDGDENSENTDNPNNIRINWYRGHTAEIVSVYRNQWCLISDLVCCELANGEIYVWCVSTAQLERRFLKDESLVFNIDREFFQCRKRNELPHLTKHEREIYDLCNTNLSNYCNILMLDVRVLGDVTLDREFNVRNEDEFDMILSNPHSKMSANKNDENEKKRKQVDSKQIDKLSDLLSLLLDWGIGAEYEPLFLQQFRVLISDLSPCYGYCGDFDSMTLLFPIASCYGGRWRIQPKVTAVYMLAINTICMWLLQCAPTNKLPVCSRLVTYYHVMLPESFQGFVEPSRNSMARYCLNSVSEIRHASRMLLHGIVQRMSDSMQLALIQKWRKRFCVNIPSISSAKSFGSLSSVTSIQHYKSNPDGTVSMASIDSRRSIDANLPTTPPGFNNNNVSSSSTVTASAASIGGTNNALILGRNGKIPLSVLLGAIVICIIHSLKRNQIEDTVAESVINTLICVLMEKVHTNSDMIKISLACDYLGKVIISWFRYVDDVEYLLKTLLDLRNCDHYLLKRSASTALLQCGVAVPQSFIKTMGNEALSISSSSAAASASHSDLQKKRSSAALKSKTHSHIDRGLDAAGNIHDLTSGSGGGGGNKKAKRHEQALMCIINLVQKYPQVLLKHIPLLVSTIIRCLDPSAPRRRKALLSATTASLHVLVTKYPNVAFHQQTQHFAIGTGPARDNCILIYDLRTTTRWKQLKGHRAAVTAIEFNHDGSYLISYSAYERPPTVKCWYIGSGGFFNSLLSLGSGGFNGYGSAGAGSAKCVKTCPMPPLDRVYPPIDHLQYTRLSWNLKVKGAVKLTRENQSVLFFTVLPK